MKSITRLLFLVSAGLYLSTNAPLTWGQQGGELKLFEEMEGTLTPDQPEMIYTFEGHKDLFLEAILDMEERDFDVTLSLLSIQNRVLAENQGLNEPNFQGAYLFHPITSDLTHKIKIEFHDIDQPVDYTILIQEYDGDEPDRNLFLGEGKEGVIGPAGDFDLFPIYLRKDQPALFYLITPKSIFDSMLGIIDTQGNIAAVNNDYFSTASVLLYTPPITGTYTILVQGAYEHSIGPYELVGRQVPLFTPPFTVSESVDYPGDIYCYEVALKPEKVYEFVATGVDGFRPFIALSDKNMNVIESNYASESEMPITSIPGFTPLNDETLFMFVAGDTPELAGGMGLSVELKEDEEDGIHLEHGSLFSGVIGPIGDEDEYTFTLEEGKTYSLLVSPTWHHLDPAMRVYNEAGKEIYYNDDSFDGVFSIWSGFTLPAGTYHVKVMASPDQSIQERLTGVYTIQFAEGTTFDRGSPLFFEPDVVVEPIASGVHVSIPTQAVGDDTYPLSATLTFESGQEDVVFEIEENEPMEIDLDISPDEIFYITLSDSSEQKNTSTAIKLPPPKTVMRVGGLPYPIAIDKNNVIYYADTNEGSINRFTIGSATEAVATDLETSGGSLGPNALAFDHNGDLYVSNGKTHSISKVLKDGTLEVVVPDLNYPVNMAFDEDNTLVVTQIGSDTVERIHTDGTREVLVDELRNPNNIAYSPDGDLYIITNDRGNCGVYRLQEDKTLEPVVEPFTETLQGMAFDNQGYLYIADGIYGFVYRMNPEHEVTVFTRWMSGPVDLAFGYGEMSKTLFASNMGIESDGVYYQEITSILTGRDGLPLPYGTTSVRDWRSY